MKTIIIILFALFARIGVAQADSTEVIIIGTVHYETENFNTDSLYNIFMELDPDVILLESDASYLTEDFKLKPGYEDIANETRAVDRYLLTHDLILRPYDIENRDEVLFSTNRRRTERNFFEELSELYEAGKLSRKAYQLTDELMANMDLAQSMTFSTPFDINREESKETIDKINYYDFEALTEIILSTPALSSYESYWKGVNDFWLLRNEAMVNNIKDFIAQFPQKRIVVLCGFAHKPYLLEGLKELNDNKKITLKNYWDN